MALIHITLTCCPSSPGVLHPLAPLILLSTALPALAAVFLRAQMMHDRACLVPVVPCSVAVDTFPLAWKISFRSNHN
ncbi:hypothetical protein POX_h09869 [Penicillium oxalicum]|uniref:Uncharacterized protein n=1 Tax=Penicillium oxalicum (strain 114-2 / CGMCC 5302) TaxID=933388 RepID=S7ZML0_PENO1|nr:hypothetical protein POX_h09869 [Penicillium oxalicum]EPS31594.1 hypothetical protein PDE_06549 [Penicillium oxalicum 114-2]KAI2786102.1 hypothetical protein POX_h09869 [Penicillium oxalicum]